MKNTPIEQHLIDETINEFQIVDFSKATIREVKAIASKAEAASGVEFIKMEMGVPGLPPSAVGVKAEIEALQNGIASLYPDINGLPELKKEASNFIKVTWQPDENGNPPTGFAVMAQGGVRGSMMAAAIVARSVVSVMEKQVGRERAKADLLGMIRLVLEQDDEVILSEGVTIALPRRVKPE